ncbi:aminotransferase [Biscogniauxia marginata]|nr:aminotransferase [Biscogniauxia marginata]
MTPSAVLIHDEVQQGSDLMAATTAKKRAAAESDYQPPLRPLDASALKVTLTQNPRPVPEVDDPVYDSCNVCTDHMITAVWNSNTGWHAPELKPYGPFSLMPTASVLHYGTECFEGLKAYRGYDGKLRLFRPDCNARRMVASALRVGLPAFDSAELEKLIIKIMEVDGARWLPKSRPGQFLYLRPALIGSNPGLGVAAPTEATLFIISVCFPQMDTISGGISLLASEDDMVRAWPGGYGYAKVGGNYAGSLVAQAEASKQGFTQVLWLMDDERKVTEAGASNFMVVWRTKEGKLQLITAPLEDKIILDGVTRRSVLQLATDRLSSPNGDLEPLEVVEKWFTMEELLEAYQEGRFLEAFAVGTAWFVGTVSRIRAGNNEIILPETVKYASQLKTWLRNIMYGEEAHEWGVVVEERPALT